MSKTFSQKVSYIIAISLALFILESIIKYYFILNKIPQQGFYLFFDLLQINYFANENIAFGLPVPQTLTIVTVGVLLIMLSFLWWQTLLKKNLIQFTAICLIIFGALSNLLDRLIVGHVIDYINIFIWPVFNLADIMIVTGVVLYLVINLKK